MSSLIGVFTTWDGLLARHYGVHTRRIRIDEKTRPTSNQHFQRKHTKPFLDYGWHSMLKGFFRWVVFVKTYEETCDNDQYF